MFCEVEFLAVGDASRAGDAIILRYGSPDNYQLMLIDGGTIDTGEKIVEHLHKFFGPNPVLEHVVLSHSDGDHASGLRNVLQEITVNNFWTHIPWRFAADALPLFQNKNWTVAGLTKEIQDQYPIIAELVEIAEEKGISLHYPFQGANIGPFVVMSPAKYTYIHLLPQFDKTPTPDQEKLEGLKFWLGKDQGSALKTLFIKLREAAQEWIPEQWGNERLKDGGVTSASNETSVVLYGDLNEGRRYLFTADAGINALNWAADYADAEGFLLQNFKFVQVPHHGSRRNVGPSILDRLLGPIQTEGTLNFSAFVSAPKEDSKHPRKIVLNAFTRRGGDVKVTAGINWLHYGGFPKREGYSSTERLPIYASVEDYD